MRGILIILWGCYIGIGIKVMGIHRCEKSSGMIKFKLPKKALSHLLKQIFKDCLNG